jgi:broad specificity phosphatase PhoE
MKDETRVWLVRHAETATPMVFHGAESDEPLSEHGSRQAAAAAEWFRELKPEVVVTSKMRRAVATGTPIAAACGIPHHLEADLHERRVGALSGTPFAVSEGPWIDTLQHWSAGHTAFTTPGAESYDEVRERLLPAWNRIVEAHRGKRVVVVAHGIVCKVLALTLVPGWGPTKWHEFGKVANLAVSELSLSSANVWQLQARVEVPPVLAVNAAAVAGLARSEA